MITSEGTLANAADGVAQKEQKRRKEKKCREKQNYINNIKTKYERTLRRYFTTK